MNRLAVITSYPEKGLVHGKKTVGVASYAKNTLLSLSRAFKGSLDITVLAEKLPDQKQTYKEKNISVDRCWQRNSWFLYGQLFKKIKKLNSKKILIEFEMSMMGGPAKNIFLPFFIFVLRLMSKEVFVVVHQVVLDFEEMSGHLGTKEKSVKNVILSFSSKLFFSLLVRSSSKTIVFEQFLKERLATISSAKKIIVIPHGVETKVAIGSKAAARKKLNLNSSDFVIAIFGYLAWYKGTDWLIEEVASHLFKNPKEKIKLVVAGGPNPNHKDKGFYQKYIDNIETVAKKFPDNITLTGFIDEKDINFYYQAADIMIYPYRTGMSSSGPLAMAFTNQKPFLLSAPLSQLLNTADIAKQMEGLKIKKENVSFSLNEQYFWDKLGKIKNNSMLQDRLSSLGKRIVADRGWENIGKMYRRAIYE